MPIPNKIRKITNWLPYSDQKRSKQMWHINKSNSTGLIIQFTDFLKISVEKKLENKSWAVAKEVLKRTMSGNKTAAPRISDSRIGTLRSDIYQMGFIKYENNKNTYELTESGHKFLENPKKTLLSQYIKLQFTNPLILNYCKDVCVFPILALIKLILDPEINFLTKNELGLIVFMNYLYDDYFYRVKEKILEYRNLPLNIKSNLIKDFKETPEGHVAIASAATVTYLTSRLIQTDVFTYHKENEISCLKIKDKYKDELKEIVNKYQNISPYPYKEKNELEYKIWFDYIGNSNVDYPPQIKQINIENNTDDIILNVIRNNDYEASYNKFGETIITHPFFNDQKYTIEIYISSQDKSISFDVYPKKDQDIFLDLNSTQIVDINEEYYIKKIRELIESKDFDSELTNKIKFISEKYKKYKFNTPSIRGARLEELFYKYISLIKNKLLINEVVWKGKINQYGLPQQTPGGPKGNPDIVIILKNKIILLELTTNSSISGQENSESLNIVRHARNYIENNNEILKKYNLDKKCLSIIFAAPVIHNDIVRSLSVILEKENITNAFLTINELIQKISTNTLLDF